MSIVTPVAFSLVAEVLASCPRCIGPEGIVDPGNRNAQLQVAADPDGWVHVGTASSVGGGCWEAYYVHSPDEGMSWAAPVRIDSDPVYVLCDVTNSSPHLHSDGSARVHALLTARAGAAGPLTLVIKSSADRGRTWPSAVVPIRVLPPRPANSGASLIAAPDGRLRAFWLEGPTDAEVHLFVSRSEDAGLTWAAPIRVDATLTDPATAYQSIRLDSGALAVALETTEATGKRLRLLRSEDDGSTWSAGVAFDDLPGPARLVLGGLIELPGGRVVVLWGDDRLGNRDLFSRLSRDGGRSFPDPPVRIDTGDAPGATLSGIPVLRRVGAGNLVAGWLDYRNGRIQVWSNASLDGGATWLDPAQAVSTFTSDTRPTSFDISGHPQGWVTAAWRDASRDAMSRCGTPSCPALYHARSCDGGVTWEPDERLKEFVVNTAHLAPLPGAADSFLFTRTSMPVVGDYRLDGPTVAEPLGPNPYCVGDDPPLRARALSAGCPGGLALQWHVDGAAVPGATGPTYQPSLAAGDHQVEVRGTCPAQPACQPAWVAATLHARAPQAPPDVGNNLRAVRIGVGARLDWSLAPPAVDVHAHLRQALAKGQPGTLLAPEPGWVKTTFDDAAPPGAPVVFYNLRRADVCEAESAN